MIYMEGARKGIWRSILELKQSTTLILYLEKPLVSFSLRNIDIQPGYRVVIYDFLKESQT